MMFRDLEEQKPYVCPVLLGEYLDLQKLSVSL